MSQLTIIRTSDRGTFKRCRRLWDWSSKIRQDLEPNTPPRPLSFGTAIHRGLEVYYEPEMWDFDREVVQANALVAFGNSMRDAYDDAMKRRGIEEFPEEEEQEYLDHMELGIGMLRHYFEWAPKQDRFRPIATEIEFEVPLPFGVPAVYQGRIDLIVEDEHGEVWIVDFKTTKAMAENIDFLQLDPQCSSYCWAVQRVNLGTEDNPRYVQVAGTIYQELLKAVPKPPRILKSGKLSIDKTQITSYDLYMKAITESGQDPGEYEDILRHLRQQEGRFFRRQQVHRSATELANVAYQIYLEAKDMISAPAIYPNPSRFNCQGCAFMAPCLAMQDGSDVEYLLKANYHKREKTLAVAG